MKSIWYEIPLFVRDDNLFNGHPFVLTVEGSKGVQNSPPELAPASLRQYQDKTGISLLQGGTAEVLSDEGFETTFRLGKFLEPMIHHGRRKQMIASGGFSSEEKNDSIPTLHDGHIKIVGRWKDCHELQKPECKPMSLPHLVMSVSKIRQGPGTKPCRDPGGRCFC